MQTALKALPPKLSAVFMQMIVVKMTNTQRFQALYAMGLLNFSAAPSDPEPANSD